MCTAHSRSLYAVVWVPAPSQEEEGAGTQTNNNPGSIAMSVGAINFSQVCTGIGRSTHTLGTRQMMRS